MQNTDLLKDVLKNALQNAFPDISDVDVCLERPKDDKNGDFASTIALRLAKQLGKNPREISQCIVDNIPQNSVIDNVEIAGPGFINFYLSDSSVANIVKVIREKKKDFAKGCAKESADDINKNVNLEYISANPTGPMHVGHGR